MSSNTQRIRLAATALGAMALLVTACSGDENGIASPGAAGEPPSSTSSLNSSTSKSPDLSGLDPCSVLETNELTVIGSFEEGSDRPTQSGRVCEWKEQRGSDGVSSTLTVTVREGVNLDSVRDIGSGLQSGRLESSGRELVRTYSSDTTACLVVMAVSQQERVEVGLSELSGSYDSQKACEMVDEVVELIDPKLPLE
ncbi:DUF3558 family protein [Saccharomonospora azurea]|uniref:DUF3558 family protein n=1 Tax=Saccharomonospora azurea TaxID=40988 RepID=UPI003322E369